MLLITPLYIYAFLGALGGFFGGRLTASDKLLDWRPGQHAQLMIMCRKTCNGQVLKYEPLTGDCTCRKPIGGK